MTYLLTLIVCTALHVCDVSAEVYPSEKACDEALTATGSLWIAAHPTSHLIAFCAPHKPT